MGKLVKDYQLITNADMINTVTSNIADVLTMDNIGIQIFWAGTPTGTFYVDVSNDDINWSTLDFGIPILAKGVADNHFININQETFKSLRVRYMPDLVTPGTGSLSAFLNKRTIGG